MDCPSEEQMIRMKLDGLDGISSLDFDIPNRKLTVLHSGDHAQILERLEGLNYGTSLVESVPGEGAVVNAGNRGAGDQIDTAGGEKRLLWQVLAINFFFFVLEITTGFISDSMGLVADSLDMLADSIVYGLALFAVGGTMALKKNIAKAAGYFQLLLAITGLAEVIRRFVGMDEVPSFGTMIIVSVLALIGNSLSLHLLQKGKSREAHMQASMIFTSNDVIVNIGVIVAGVLVFLTQSQYPDLIVGTIVFLLVARGAFKILALGK